MKKNKISFREEAYIEVSNLINSLIKFEDFFNSSIVELVKLIESYGKVEKSESNGNSLMDYLMFREENYKKSTEKKKIILEFKRKLVSINSYHLEYEKNFLKYEGRIRNFKLTKIDTRTIDNLFEKLKRWNEEISLILIIFENESFNCLIKKKNKLSKIVFKIVETLYIVENMVFEDLYYMKDIDLKKLKSLGYLDLKEGDIIIVRKASRFLTYYRKLIRKLLDSNFIHSAIVYKVMDDEVYVFEANAYNERKTAVDKLEKVKGYSYIVLRYKEGLSETQLEKLRTLEDKYLDIEFSYLKTLGAFYERLKELYLQNNILPLKRKKNPFYFLNGTFCSEIVSKIYDEIGIRLGFNSDNSIISPLDIMNSPELEIVGYLKFY